MPGDLQLMPDHSPIPDIIGDVDVSVSDINSLLFVIDKLPNIKKVHVLMATLIPVWLASRLPSEDHDHEQFHQALTALYRFYDLPPTGWAHQALSPVPDILGHPVDIPPAPTSSHPDDVNADMFSDKAPKAADSPMIVKA